MVVPTFLKERQQRTEAKYSRNRQKLELAFAKPSQKREIALPVAAPTEEENTYIATIHWTRGRFSGQAVHILVRDGVISERFISRLKAA